MERTPREGHTSRSGWFWSRNELSWVGRQVLVRLTEEISNLPVFISSDRFGGVHKRRDLHAMIGEYLQKLLHDIRDLTGAGFQGEPDPDKCEELDIVERCVWALILLQVELIPGLRYRCIMCNSELEEKEDSVFRLPASVGVRVDDTHSTCGYWTVMELSLLPYRRDCDPPKLCANHDLQFRRALNAIVRVVPSRPGMILIAEHDTSSGSSRHSRELKS